MLRLFAKLTPPVAGRHKGEPFLVTDVSQYPGDAAAWWDTAPNHEDHDILIVDFPECRHQDALDFMAWIRHHPRMVDVMEALEGDKIFWHMYSLEYRGHGSKLKTPLNNDDLKFLKSLRVSWNAEESASDQSGLHLV